MAHGYEPTREAAMAAFGTFEQAKIGNVVVITKDTKQGRDTYNIRVVGSNFVSDKWHDLDPVAAQCVLYVLFPK